MYINYIAYSQLSVTTTMSPQQLVNMLVGQGVTVSNISYSGSVINHSAGYFSNGNTTNLGLTSGIILSSGKVEDIANSAFYLASNFNNTGSDPDLETLIPGYTIYDATVLEFDFVPQSDTIKFRYVFGSDEYPEFVNTSFNDVFGFFISGPDPSGGSYNSKNIALIPGTSLPVTIDNINNVAPSYPQYYVNNEGLGGTTICYDGFTTVLTAWCIVVPCQTYHIKLAIGDAGDDALDSGVLLEKNSFSSDPLNISITTTSPNINDEMAIEGCNDGIIDFKLNTPYAKPLTINYVINGTAVNGTDYMQIPENIVIPAGEDSAGLIISPVNDGIIEPTETVILIIQSLGCGADTAILEIKDNSAFETQVSNDTSVCKGGTANICASASGGISPYSYNWNAPGSTNCISVMPAVTTTYTVNIEDMCGNSEIDTVEVKINDLVNADAGPDITVCNGNPAVLIASGGLRYHWSNDIDNYSNTVYPDINVTYTVTAYDQSGCSDEDIAAVTVNPLPDIIADASELSIPVDESVTLNAEGADTYVWSSSPNDPSLTRQENMQNPVVSPSTTTTYTVYGTDAYSCTNSATVEIKTRYTFYTPNTFTPNGDGKNDIFRPYGTSIFDFNMKIYSRWGTLVFESNDINYGWDGLIEGNPAEQGVYNYIITFKNESGFIKNFFGSITLYK